VALFLSAGYFFGGISFVKDNLSLVMFAIIIVSFLPPIIEFAKSKRKGKENATQ
jgi:membrane-associated protein